MMEDFDFALLGEYLDFNILYVKVFSFFSFIISDSMGVMVIPLRPAADSFFIGSVVAPVMGRSVFTGLG